MEYIFFRSYLGLWAISETCNGLYVNWRLSKTGKPDTSFWKHQYNKPLIVCSTSKRLLTRFHDFKPLLRIFVSRVIQSYTFATIWFCNSFAIAEICLLLLTFSCLCICCGDFLLQMMFCYFSNIMIQYRRHLLVLATFILPFQQSLVSYVVLWT